MISAKDQPNQDPRQARYHHGMHVGITSHCLQDMAQSIPACHQLYTDKPTDHSGLATRHTF